MKKRVIGGLLLAGLLLLATAPSVQADSLRIRPLQYQTDLKKGEKKKGFVDITNPTADTVTVALYVNGFRQTDNSGNLTFFDSEQIKTGLLLDYDSATIGPYQTLRLFFIADGTKLPPGDVFGVLFAHTKPAGRPGTNTTVRVGSLIMITNQTPGARHAEISRLDVPFMQLGDGVGGIIAVKNPAPPGSATGYFPAMTVELWPWGGKTEFTGPLVFAGNTRTFDFYMPGSLFGVFIVKARANDAEQTAVMIAMTGWWRAVGPIAAMVIIAGAVFLKRYFAGRSRAAGQRR